MMRLPPQIPILPLLMLLSGSLTAQCYRLVWSDEFDGGSLDTSRWEYQTGDGCPSLCGWGNAEAQWYREENVEVSGGTLKIHVREESVGGRDYTSARLRSFGKWAGTTGRIEARMKMPSGQGLWPAFWMLPEESHYGIWPMSGEIDIMEMIGSLPSTVFGTIHYGAAFPANQYIGNTTELSSGTLADDFHVYAVEWEQDVIRWYFNDELYSTLTPEDLLPYPWRFDRDFHLILNVAVGGFFPGYPDATTVFPQVMEVDYVRVYQDVPLTLISGPGRIVPGSQDAAYYVQPVDDASYLWQVPDGADVVAGQGSPQALVDWGESSGPLRVVIESPACSTTLERWIEVAPQDCADTLLSFDAPGRISWISSDGVYDDDAANPAPDAVNNSARVARYERNSAVSFNVLRFTADGFSDASVFKSGDLLLEMDVYTNAPPGAVISLQLENMQRAALPFPTGRNSIYQAITSATNDWHRLRFSLTQSPDLSLADNRINQFLVLFQPGTFSNALFWFDNLRIVDAGCAQTGLSGVQASPELRVWPNPASDLLYVSGEGPLYSAQVYDAAGRLILELSAEQASSGWDIRALEPGTYWLRVRTRQGWTAHSFVKNSAP